MLNMHLNRLFEDDLRRRFSIERKSSKCILLHLLVAAFYLRDECELFECLVSTWLFSAVTLINQIGDFCYEIVWLMAQNTWISGLHLFCKWTSTTAAELADRGNVFLGCTLDSPIASLAKSSYSLLEGWPVVNLRIYVHLVVLILFRLKLYSRWTPSFRVQLELGRDLVHVSRSSCWRGTLSSASYWVSSIDFIILCTLTVFESTLNVWICLAWLDKGCCRHAFLGVRRYYSIQKCLLLRWLIPAWRSLGGWLSPWWNWSWSCVLTILHYGTFLFFVGLLLLLDGTLEWRLPWCIELTWG